MMHVRYVQILLLGFSFSESILVGLVVSIALKCLEDIRRNCMNLKGLRAQTNMRDKQYWKSREIRITEMIWLSHYCLTI